MKFSSTLVAVWVAVAVSPVLALQCYNCDPRQLGPTACEDPFNANLTSMPTSNCGDGEKILCVKVVAYSKFNKSEKLTGRSCSNKGSQTCNKLRDGLREEGVSLLSCKTCSTELCNGATGPKSLIYVSTRLSVFLVIVISIFISI